MAMLNIHHAVEGAAPLVEYRGTPSAIVLLTPLYRPTAALLRSLGLDVTRSQSLAGWRDVALAAGISAVQLVPQQTRLLDVNGFAHLVLPAAAALSAGDTLLVEATEV